MVLYLQKRAINIWMEPIFHPKLANYLKTILTITQAGSHRSNIDHHVRTVKTTYLFKSVLFQLLDVLVWFKIYIDSDPKKENWVRIEQNIDSNSTGIREADSWQSN